MSTFGTKTRDLLQVHLSKRWTSSEGNPPGSPVWILQVNGLEVTFQTRPGWRGRDSWLFSPSTGQFGGPGFFIESCYDVDFAAPHISGDFDESWWGQVDAPSYEFAPGERESMIFADILDRWDAVHIDRDAMIDGLVRSAEQKMLVNWEERYALTIQFWGGSVPVFNDAEALSTALVDAYFARKVRVEDKHG